MERDKVVEWVQKLMTKAADPGATEGERDAAQQKATEFMVKYKVSMMEATTADEIKGHDMLREDINFAVPGRTSWGYHLAWAIAPVFECKALRLSGTKTMAFFGFPEDVKTSVYFYRTLQMQIIFAVDATSYDTVKTKNSYAEGMVDRIRERLAAAYKRMEEIVPATTMELMVVKKGAVKKFRESHFPKIKKNTLRPQIDPRAYTRGYYDGSKLDIANNAKKKVRG